MKNYYIYTLILFIFFRLPCLHAQETGSQKADSTAILAIPLDEVIVTAYEDNRRVMEVPGTVHSIQKTLISKTDETSLVQAVNTVPGIRMEQRSPSSYRISIRGSSLRSPFDVRNVKVYWNGVPFTDPSGITPLNLLDPVNISSIEILKGPASSIYGAGNGGTLLMYTENPLSDSTLLKGSIKYGGYGLRRLTATYAWGNRQSKHLVNISHIKSDGYREHTSMERNTFQYYHTYFPSANHKTSINVFASDLFYQVPGGLTREQYEENPRQARPSSPWFPGSVEQNSHVDYKAVFSSISHEITLNPNWKNKTAVYGRYSFFIMPFITDFERELRQGWGGRTHFEYNSMVGNTNLRWLTGLEYQDELFTGRNFGNDGGQPDTLNFDDEVTSWQGLAFSKISFEFPQQVFLDLSLSLNNQEYDIHRLYDALLDTSFRQTKNFDPVFMPRAGLLKQMNDNLSVFVSISKGFSPPSVKEVRTGDGNLNIDLQPETGLNYEFGYRGQWFNNALFIELTLFDFSLSETIVSFTDSVSNVVKFRNSGATTQRGLEAVIRWQPINRKGHFLESFSIQTAHSFHDFYFEEYIREGNDYSGNELTGVAPHINSSVISLGFSPGIYWHLSANYTDRIPLNDANTVYSDAFLVLNTKAGYNFKGGKFSLEFFGGITNVFDITYSLGNDLNAFGHRYYQPAPGRNIYFGLQVTI
ncbi:MAG: TonB-dependent receptor [Bacteroidota bacterium]